MVALSGINSAIATEQKNEEVAARVNGVIITFQAVERAEALIQSPPSDESTELTLEDRKQRSRRALDNLITEELLYQEAVAQKIKIDEEKVYEVIRQMKESMPGAKFSKLAFAHWAVKGEIMKTIERDLMIKELFKKMVTDQTEVTDDEMLQFYNRKQEFFRIGSEVKLQQIFLFAESEWQAELMRGQAKEIKIKAQSGENFIELAKTYSQGPGRDQAGDFGWRSIKHLPLKLKSAVQDADIGKVIGPIQMPGGLLIAKVIDKRPSRVAAFSEVRTHLESTLKKNKLMERRDVFLQELHSRADIEVLLK